VNPDVSAALITGMAIWVDTTAVPDRTTADVAAAYAQEVFPTAFARWMVRVSTLLELWTGQGIQRFLGSRSEGPVVQLFDHNTDTGYTAEAAEIASWGSAARVGFRYVSLADWRLAAQLISDGDPLGVAWPMFNRAQKLARTEPRFAVIEACTAVEVAVGQRVSDSLFGYLLPRGGTKTDPDQRSGPCRAHQVAQHAVSPCRERARLLQRACQASERRSPCR